MPDQARQALPTSGLTGTLSHMPGTPSTGTFLKPPGQPDFPYHHRAQNYNEHKNHNTASTQHDFIQLSGSISTSSGFLTTFKI